MNATPERALELAEMMESGQRILTSELLSVLRHYAEIAPRYAAIMAAEPVATLERDEDGHFCVSTDSWSARAPVGVHQLIIKPA